MDAHPDPPVGVSEMRAKPFESADGLSGRFGQQPLFSADRLELDHPSDRDLADLPLHGITIRD